MLRGASQDGSHQLSRSERPLACIFTPRRPDPPGSHEIPVSTAGAESQQALGLGMSSQRTQNLPLAYLHPSFHICFPISRTSPPSSPSHLWESFFSKV